MQRRCVRACTVHGQRKAAVTASHLAAAAVSGEVQPAGPPKLAHRQCHRGSLARPASVRRSCGDGQAAVLQRMHCVVLTWGGGSLGSHSASTLGCMVSKNTVARPATQTSLSLRERLKEAARTSLFVHVKGILQLWIACFGELLDT